LYMGSLTKVEKLSRKHVMHKNFVIGAKKIAAKWHFTNSSLTLRLFIYFVSNAHLSTTVWAN
jgi:hypothetical protein